MYDHLRIENLLEIVLNNVIFSVIQTSVYADALLK